MSEVNDTAMVVRKTPEGVVLLPSSSDIIVPAYLSSLLARLNMEPARWVSVLSEVLARPTPPEWVQPREGPHKMTLYYVEGAYAKITRQAISYLGIASDLDVLQTDVTPEEVNCLCKLSFKFHGEIVSAMQWGMCMRRSGVALGYTKKGAVTDGEKKCMNEFGWAMDVYTSEAGVAEAPDPEEMKTKAIDGLYEIGSRVGLSKAEVDKVVGVDPATLDPAALTAAKRKLGRLVNEHVDEKTRTEKVDKAARP